MKHCLMIISIFLLSGLTGSYAQGSRTVQVVFYNVENYFDIQNDTATLDDDFTPEGRLAWNSYKYHKKQKNLFKVISNTGHWDPPALVCLSEVENEKVLKDLINNTPLKNYDYGLIHYDSPDERGIDVALLYRKSVFQVSGARNLKVWFPFDSLNRTRDILYVKGQLADQILHVYINHWPSRMGGVMASEKYRLSAAGTLLDHLGEVFSGDSLAKVIILGDFNDEEKDQSIRLLTDFKYNSQSVHLLQKVYPEKVKGTLKYQGIWYTFDHFLVSSGLMDERGNICLAKNRAMVFAPDFLLTEDSRRIGYKPHRTYLGPKYTGGYSDHLPVYIELKLKTD